MIEATKTKVFMSGRSQAVRIPAEFRFASAEVFIRRNPNTGDLILSQAPASIAEILAALDEIGIPDDFLSPDERAQEAPQQRPEL